MAEQNNFSLERFKQDKESRDLVKSFINYCANEIMDLKAQIQSKAPDFKFEIESYRAIEVQTQKVYQLNLRLRHLKLIYDHIKKKGAVNAREVNELLLEARLKQEEDSFKDIKSQTESDDEIDEEYRKKYSKIYKELIKFIHSDTNAIKTDGLDINSKEFKEAQWFNDVLEDTTDCLFSYYYATTKSKFKIFTDVVLPNILTKLGRNDTLNQTDKKEAKEIVKLIKSSEKENIAVSNPDVESPIESNQQDPKSDLQQEIITRYFKFIKEGFNTNKRNFQQAIIDVLNKTDHDSSDLTLEEMHSKYAALLEEKKSLEKILEMVNNDLEIPVDQRQIDIQIAMKKLLKTEEELVSQIDELNKQIKDIGNGVNTDISTLVTVDKNNGLIQGKEIVKPKGFHPETLKDIQNLVPRFIQALKAAARDQEFSYDFDYEISGEKNSTIKFGDGFIFYDIIIIQDEGKIFLYCRKVSRDQGFEFDPDKNLVKQLNQFTKHYQSETYVIGVESHINKTFITRSTYYNNTPLYFDTELRLENDLSKNTQIEIDRTYCEVFSRIKKSLQESLGINIDDYDPEAQEEAVELTKINDAGNSSLVLKDNKSEIEISKESKKYNPETLDDVLNILPDVFNKILESIKNDSSYKYEHEQDSKYAPLYYDKIFFYKNNEFYRCNLTYKNNKLVSFHLQKKLVKAGFEINPKLSLYQNMYSDPADSIIENLDISIFDIYKPTSSYYKFKYLSNGKPESDYKLIYEIENNPNKESQENIDYVNAMVFDQLKIFLKQNLRIDLI